MPQGICLRARRVGISFRNETDQAPALPALQAAPIPHPDPAMQPLRRKFSNTNLDIQRAHLRSTWKTCSCTAARDERFDMNMHILSFAPGGCHPFVETHVQEHRRVPQTKGEGLYLLNDDWVPVKAEDFIWMGAYCKQCCYGVGLTRLSYIYSKDCHRDAGFDAGGPPRFRRRAAFPKHRRHTMERYHDHFRKPQAAGPS